MGVDILQKNIYTRERERERHFYALIVKILATQHNRVK